VTDVVFVRAAVDIGYRSFVEENLEDLVADIARCGTHHRRFAEHVSNDVQNMRYSAKSIVILLKRCFLQYDYPSVDLIEVHMVRGICSRVLAPGVGPLLRRSVLNEVVWFLFQHKGDDLQENTP
jgi:hypothetical protein